MSRIFAFHQLLYCPGSRVSVELHNIHTYLLRHCVIHGISKTVFKTKGKSFELIEAIKLYTSLYLGNQHPM